MQRDASRAELTPAERAEWTAKRKRLYECLHPETKHGGDRKGSSRKVCDLIGGRFTAETAERSGRSERAVQLDATRGELTAAERAEWTAKRKRLYEFKHGKAKARGANAANKVMGRDANANLADAFTTETAARSGQSERKVRRDATRGERIAPRGAARA